MTDRDIRAFLRGATRDRILNGWYWHGEPGGPSLRFVVNTATGAIATYPRAEAASYCSMLEAAGVEPLYRQSEPIF